MLFTLMVISISSTATAMLGRKPNFPQLAMANCGWLIWIGGTFVVIYLARRFPFERTFLAKGICLHVALGLLVALMILCIEFGIRRTAESRSFPAGVRTTFFGLLGYRFHSYFIIYWMILGATRAHDYYVEVREARLLTSQLETKLAQAQLQSLKEQLQPHFLFNTHHSIIALMLKNENAAAIAMLTRLSDLLRMTLDRTNDQHNALKDELDAMNLYLSIQKERYRDRLQIQINVEPALLSAEVPCLILQPLVENAIKHGVDAIVAAGLLNVRAWREDRWLCLSVRDNGPGMGPLTNGGDKKIGLQNTMIRLERLYGDQQKFEILPNKPTGTEIRISIPFRTFTHGSPSQAEASDG